MAARTVVSFTKLASPGSILASSLKVGDLLLKAIDSSNNDVTSVFASFVLTDGEILQLGSDESDPLPTVTALFEREAMFS